MTLSSAGRAPFLFATFSVFWLPAVLTAQEQPVLVFKKAGKEVARLSTAQLRAKIEPMLVSLFDPDYGKKKSFRCFPMAAVMDAAYGKGWESSGYTEAALTAADGYAAQAEAATLRESGGCLAFEDADVPGWEPVGRLAVDPGPFYLVWTQSGQTAQNAYPWPWQLVSVDLIRFEDRYSEVVPKGAPEGSPEYRGYKLFRASCLRCHSINRQGGKIGPDLNAPQSVADYRTKDWIKSYVRQPSKYRYTEMPDHTRLSDQNLEDLYAYFRFKSKQPEKQRSTPK